MRKTEKDPLEEYTDEKLEALLGPLDAPKKHYNMKAYGRTFENLTENQILSIIEDEEVDLPTIRGNKVFVKGKCVATLEEI